MTVATMSGGGSVILSDVREPTLVIICEPCGRRGRYNVERLMAERGDAKLTDLLATLADCPKARSVSDRCKGVHEGL
jgi:RNase P subunit RPR2